MKSSNTSLSAKKWLTGNCEPLFVYGALSQKCTLSFGVMMAQRKKSVDLHFLLHRHKAGGASPLGAACFEALACVFASADASLRILMIPRQKTSDSWLMCASSNMAFHCQGVRKSWRYFIHAPQLAKYARPAAQKGCAS